GAGGSAHGIEDGHAAIDRDAQRRDDGSARVPAVGMLDLGLRDLPETEPAHETARQAHAAGSRVDEHLLRGTPRGDGQVAQLHPHPDLAHARSVAGCRADARSRRYIVPTIASAYVPG